MISTGLDSSIVIEMYDPNRLQIRADVRLEDVAMVVAELTLWKSKRLHPEQNLKGEFSGPRVRPMCRRTRWR